MAQIFFDFDKPTMSKGIMDLLSNGLQEDPYKDVLTVNLKESIGRLTKGYKLAYGPANDLLAGILRALSLEDSDIADEIALVQPPSTQSDESTPNPGSNSGSGPSPPPDSNDSNDSNDSKDSKEHNSKKTSKDLCRFFARGKCTRSKDCRFNHPSICKKFRQFGSISTNSEGCDGKCEAFHPNACRSSLHDKTCSFKDCRFYHLKGTKTIDSNSNTRSHSNSNSNSRDASKKNWRSNQQGKNQGQSGNRNQNEKNSKPKHESKNRFTGLNQKDQNHDRDSRSGPAPKAAPKEDPEKIQLSQTLEAIMKRLTAMESRQSMYHPPGMQMHHPVQPLLSPAVPQPGSQTQHQWGSPNQWTQTQY